jgi:hypothetical protein
MEDTRLQETPQRDGTCLPERGEKKRKIARTFPFATLNTRTHLHFSLTSLQHDFSTFHLPSHSIVPLVFVRIKKILIEVRLSLHVFEHTTVQFKMISDDFFFKLFILNISSSYQSKRQGSTYIPWDSCPVSLHGKRYFGNHCEVERVKKDILYFDGIL